MTTTSAAVTIIGHSRLAVGMLSNSLSTSSISRASGVDARLDLSAVPLLDGALATVSAGLCSSLHPHNVRLRRAVAGVDRLGDDPRYLLLYDPPSVRSANHRRPAGRRAGRSGRRLPRRAARGGLRAICRHRLGRTPPRPRLPDSHRVTAPAGRAAPRPVRRCTTPVLRRDPSNSPAARSGSPGARSRHAWRGRPYNPVSHASGPERTPGFDDSRMRSCRLTAAGIEHRSRSPSRTSAPSPTPSSNSATSR